jgi:hypothetical protein
LHENEKARQLRIYKLGEPSKFALSLNKSFLRNASQGRFPLYSFSHGCATLKNRGIPHLPIAAALVEGLQAPVLQRPASSQGRIPFVDFTDEFRHWSPSEVTGDFAAHAKVDTRDKEVAARLNEPGEIEQARFCFLAGHVTKEPICEYDVLKAHNTDEVRISGVPDLPDDPLSKRWFDLQ